MSPWTHELLPYSIRRAAKPKALHCSYNTALPLCLTQPQEQLEDCTMHRTSILIDSDPEIDDSVAILFALASPTLSIKAVTTVSNNLLADKCSVNARKTLKLSG